MLYAIIGMLVIIADQYIKFWVQGHIPLTSAGEEFIPGILSLVNVHNEGAAFGFLAGSGARIPFIILAGVFTVAVIIALATKLISGKLARWSIVLVTAGALSNCLDRVLYGYVQDMFKTEFMNFPVFNLADVFITIFAIIFALAVIFGKTRKDDDDDYEFEDDEEEEKETRRTSRKKEKRSKRRASRYEDEDDYEFEDDEEEEEEPVQPRKSLKEKRSEKRAAKRAAAKVAEDEDEDEPVPAPARRPAPQAVRQQKPAPAPKRPAAAAKAVAEDEDPFAGWDRPEAKPAAPAKKAAAEKTSAAKPAAKSAAPAKAAQARTAARSAQPAEAPAKRPAAKPAAAPAPRPTPKPVAEEEFSLDDILNEFR